jgi:hypothetical protein
VKAGIWRAFLTEERKFSENENARLGRKDLNLKMVNWNLGERGRDHFDRLSNNLAQN